MYYVYILKSRKDNTRYVGLSRDPERRLQDHNLGRSKYTKGHKPYDLIYKEVCVSRTLARQREQFLKSGVGREKFDNLFPCSSVGRASGC